MSKEWIRQRKHDAYYRKAKVEGYRSRAAYKLKEINKRLRLIRRGGQVLDLGASPGGWSQVAMEMVGDGGTVVAVDMIPMDRLEGVKFVPGDIEDPGTLERVQSLCPEFDVVISDAAPHLSGNRTLDRGRSLSLSRAVMLTASKVLRMGGSVLVKVFQGPEVDELLEEFREHYRSFDRMKPPSSLKKSIEIYLAFRGFRHVPGRENVPGEDAP